ICRSNLPGEHLRPGDPGHRPDPERPEAPVDPDGTYRAWLGSDEDTSDDETKYEAEQRERHWRYRQVRAPVRGSDPRGDQQAPGSDQENHEGHEPCDRKHLRDPVLLEGEKVSILSKLEVRDRRATRPAVLVRERRVPEISGMAVGEPVMREA